MKIRLLHYWMIAAILLTACNAATSSPAKTVIPSKIPAPTRNVGATASAMYPAVTAAPSPTEFPPSPTPWQPFVTPAPACTFPLAQTTKAVSPSEKYTFSWPKMVLTDENYYPDVAGWLPDNQNAIILPIGESSDHRYIQTIKLFDPETQKTQTYAIRNRNRDSLPVWNPDLKSIIYLDWKHNTNENRYVPELRMSNGNADKTLLLSDDEPGEEALIKPDGSQIVYLRPNDKNLALPYSRAVTQQGSLEAEQLIPFDASQFGYLQYSMTWRAGTSQMLFYSYDSPIKQIFLFDTNTQQSCALAFGAWVYFARWSPNGRYLAIIKAAGPMVSIYDDYDLNILDALTGKIYQIDSKKIGPQHTKTYYRRLMESFEWAPDNRHLVIIATGANDRIDTTRELYLVDFLFGEVSPIFPGYNFGFSAYETSLAWSPDRTKILAKCSEKDVKGLCLIYVKRTVQP